MIGSESSSSSPPQPNENFQNLRRSTRDRQPPAWHQEYFMSAAVNHSSLAQVLVKYTVEPTTYSQAVQFPHWQAAMDAELQALQRNNTWSLVPLPTGHKPIDCRIGRVVDNTTLHFRIGVFRFLFGEGLGFSGLQIVA
ncbi:hypothetical protein HPP92_011959 [Vanilla planifolia]|uniref:Retrotransposon Copia-like N-terminal domain-containing protein n=1 Tax=Vanilla planifolia TaxID=51239 RepID=A0A835R1S0_VANPL|nr:hypothetical protein HPP92_011959 [Vanilla planifolia]